MRRANSSGLTRQFSSTLQQQKALAMPTRQRSRCCAISETLELVSGACRCHGCTWVHACMRPACALDLSRAVAVVWCWAAGCGLAQAQAQAQASKLRSSTCHHRVLCQYVR